MSYPEFYKWISFYNDFPFDDFHRYLRPAALVAAASGSMGKISSESVTKILSWLEPEQIPEGINAADYSIIKALGGNVNLKD